jgi:hypothetical protein
MNNTETLNPTNAAVDNPNAAFEKRAAAEPNVCQGFGPVPRKGEPQQTFLGGQFWLLDPRPEEIDIRDIAHALSQTCRYRGMPLRYYSVLEHCVLLATYTQTALGRPMQDVLAALLHDAHEAYSGDVITPYKNMYPEIRTFEHSLQNMIQEKYGVPAGKPEWLNTIDQRIRWDEKMALMVPRNDWKGMHADGPLNVAIQAWESHKAESIFLSAFNTLTSALRAEAQTKATFSPDCELCGPAKERVHPGKCRVASRIVRVK